VEGGCKTSGGKEDGAAMRKSKQKYRMWYRRKTMNSRKKPVHLGCRGQNMRPNYFFSPGAL